jgi:signal transduction histidine kinase
MTCWRFPESPAAGYNCGKSRLISAALSGKRSKPPGRSFLSRSHQLHLWLPSEPISLNAYAGRMEQVVVNLLTNATKYTDEGGKIWLNAEQKDGE